MARGVKSGGRQKGSVNKITSTVKDNVLAVFNRLSGTAGMAEWAESNKTEFYKIYARLIPSEVDSKLTHSGEIKQRVEVHIIDPKG